MLSVKIKSINVAIKQIEKYADDLQKKADEITKKLAEIGMKEANVVLIATESHGQSIGVNSTSDVSIEPIENGYKVVASGKEIFFIEFGAGVYYNGAESYYGERPSGIKGIGEYGKGKGKEEGWWYSLNGESIYTHGTPAQMPMYFASKEIQANIEKVVKEVFK